MLIKNNKQLFSLLLGLFLHNSLSAVTIKNEPLTNFLQPGEVLYATFPENSYIILDTENNNFDIHQGNIEHISNLKETFQYIKDRRSGFSMSSQSIDLSSNTMNYNSSYLNGQEYINLQGKTSLQFTDCLLESPFISITGNKIHFTESFLINPKILNIIVNAPESDYDSIQILFYNQPENPTVITGEIDFEDNQSAKRLFISNVKEIRVQFIWDKNSPRQSNIENKPAITKISQPSFMNYQSPNKSSLKESFSYLFSPECMPFTILYIAIILCCIPEDLWKKVKVSNQ